MSISNGKRVVLCDDHEIVRDAIKSRMANSGVVEIVGEAGDGREVVDVVKDLDPDVVIIDVEMPKRDGIEATKEVLKARPRTKVIIFTAHAQPDLLALALRAGASGYVLKSAADRDLVEACRSTMRGEPFLYPAAVSALIRDHLEHAREGNGRTDILTPRELEILKLIAEANTSRQIADTLVLSIKTVERHRANILEKLGMRDRVELTRYAIRRGLVEP
jgi:DNA-binding NarL/FixJ family response regulator